MLMRHVLYLSLFSSMLAASQEPTSLADSFEVADRSSEVYELQDLDDHWHPIAKTGRYLSDTDVVVGVDQHGRIAAAADADKDGLIDRTYRFVPAEPIHKQFEFTLSAAEVSLGNAVLIIRANDDSFLLWASLKGASVAPPETLDAYAFKFVHTNGVEIASDSKFNESEFHRMEYLSFRDALTWPASFWVVQPGASHTQGGGLFCETGCETGGPGSQACSIDGCFADPEECFVRCATGYYACCKCSGFVLESAKCRCCPDDPQ